MPGPVMTYTIEKALVKGRHTGLVIIVGHAILEIALIFSVFFGFGIILKSNPAQIIIGLLGGALLVYMGFNMVFTARKNNIAIQSNSKNRFSNNVILSGFFLSASNPYFILWWAVVGLSFIIQSYDKLGYIGVLIYFFGHISADFMIYGTISFLVGSAKKFIQGRAYRIIIASLGCAMICFGAKFILVAINTINIKM